MSRLKWAIKFLFVSVLRKHFWHRFFFGFFCWGVEWSNFIHLWCWNVLQRSFQWFKAPEFMFGPKFVSFRQCCINFRPFSDPGTHCTVNLRGRDDNDSQRYPHLSHVDLGCLEWKAWDAPVIWHKWVWNELQRPSIQTIVRSWTS